jgi:hypothetical protein
MLKLKFEHNEKQNKKTKVMTGVAQHFVGVLGFAISGLIIKICGFAICRLA